MNLWIGPYNGMNVSRRAVGEIWGEPVGEVLLAVSCGRGRTLVRREEKALFCLMVAMYQMTMVILGLYLCADL